MKKLTLALITSAVVLSTAHAHSISTGFYLGAHGGYGSTTSQYTATNAVGLLPTGFIEFGGNGGNIGFHGGYGCVSGNVYYGAELSYTFESNKLEMNVSNNALLGGVQLKRNGYLRGALRGGYLFHPSTLVYIALGSNWGRWVMRDAGTGVNPFTRIITASGNKIRPSFAPAVGIEAALDSKIYLRFEYIYDFAPSVRATNAAFPAAYGNIKMIRNQSGKVGLSYKF